MAGLIRWTLEDLLKHRCTTEEYVAGIKADVDERLATDRSRRVARALEAREAARKHRSGKAISFSWPRWPL